MDGGLFCLGRDWHAVYDRVRSSVRKEATPHHRASSAVIRRVVWIGG
jgi:hypothetical protein